MAASAAKPAVANTTFGAPVYRGDGTRLYGLDAELELKAQEKRDPELETNLERWIEEVIGESLEPKGSLQKSLKSGVALCKLINKIWPGTIKTINTKPIGMMEMENIGTPLRSDAALCSPHHPFARRFLSQELLESWSVRVHPLPRPLSLQYTAWSDRARLGPPPNCS